MRYIFCGYNVLASQGTITLKEQVDVHVRRAAVLRGLPAYLHDDDSRFLKLWDVSQPIVRACRAAQPWLFRDLLSCMF